MSNMYQMPPILHLTRLLLACICSPILSTQELSYPIAESSTLPLMTTYSMNSQTTANPRDVRAEGLCVM